MTITKVRREFGIPPELPEAINKLSPNCAFSISVFPGTREYDWTTLNWSEGNPTPPPTEQEAKNKLQELTEEWESKTYRIDRFMAYPTIESQLAMLFDDIKNGVPLSEGTWFQSIQQVKDDNPKP